MDMFKSTFANAGGAGGSSTELAATAPDGTSMGGASAGAGGSPFSSFFSSLLGVEVPQEAHGVWHEIDDEGDGTRYCIETRVRPGTSEASSYLNLNDGKALPGTCAMDGDWHKDASKKFNINVNFYSAEP